MRANFRGQVIPPRGGSSRLRNAACGWLCGLVSVTLDTLRLTPTVTPLNFLFYIPTPARNKNEFT
jgi:hypothetical protein